MNGIGAETAAKKSAKRLDKRNVTDASKKVQKACDRCHSLKRRCDGQQPCATCGPRRKCTYERPPGVSSGGTGNGVSTELLSDLVTQMTRIGKILENGAQVPTAVDATPNLSSLLAATSSLVLNLVPDGTTSVNRPERSPSPTLVTADTETLLNMDVSAWRAQITEENARHLMAMPPMIGSGGQNGHSAHFNGRGLSGDTYYTSQPDADLLPPVTSKKRKLTEDHADWMMSPYNIASSGTPAADVDMYHLIGTSEATDDIFEPFVNLDPVSLGLGMLESQHVDEVMSTLCETSPAVPIPAQMPSRSTESVGSSAAKPSPYTPPTTNAKLSKSPTSLSLTSSTAHEGLSTSPPSPLSHIVLLARDTKYLTQKSREELQSCVDEVELLVQELQAVAFQQGGSPPAQSASPTSESPKLPNVEIKTLEPVSTIISEATSYGNRPKEATWPEEEGFQADEDLLVSLRVDPLPQLLSIMTRLNPALLSEDETKYILEKYLGTSVCWCSIGMPAALLLGPNAVKNPLLLNMSLAYGFRYLRQRRQAEIFLARAKRVLASVDELSLTTVRAVFMMGSYAGDQGKSSWGHAWTVLALYKALEMGLQHPPPPASTLPPSSPPPRLLNPLEYEFRTRIPWFLYISAVDYAFNYDNALHPQPSLDAFASLPLPSDELWNGLDDLGHPIPGTPAEAIVSDLSSRGLCAPVPLSDPSNPRDLQHRFPSYGFLERCKMYRILHRVRTFAKLKAGRPDASCEDTVESLELALSKWEAALPEYIKNALRSEVSPQEAEDDGVPKQEEMVFHAAHFLRLMFCLARVLLHRPSATVSPDGGPSLVWPTPRSQEICYSTAYESSIIVTRLLLRNPDCSRVNTFAFHPVFQCGAVHALCRHELQSAIPIDDYLDSIVGPHFKSKTPGDLLAAAIQRTEEGLTVHLEMLRRMAHCWGAGGNYYMTLRRMGEGLI